MEKIAIPMVGVSGSEQDPAELAQDPQFQDALVEILSSGRVKVR